MDVATGVGKTFVLAGAIEYFAGTGTRNFADFGSTPDGRGEYVEAFFRNLDWDHVNRQLAQAEAARRGAQQSGANE